MSQNLYNCANCGASLSLEQLRGTDCPFCRKVFPHHGAAVQQAALVNQVMAQNMGGVNPWMQQPGVPPAYGAPPAQYGANMPPPQQYGYGYGQQMVQVDRAVRKSIMLFVILGAVIFLLTIGGVVAALLLSG